MVDAEVVARARVGRVVGDVLREEADLEAVAVRRLGIAVRRGVPRPRVGAWAGTERFKFAST